MALAAEYSPTAQPTTENEFFVGHFWPASQVKHASTPATENSALPQAVEDVRSVHFSPAGHGVHAAALAAVAIYPTGQANSERKPAGQKLPTVHASHELAPYPENSPVAQAVGAAETLEQREPAGQMSHVIEPVLLE